MDAKTKANSNTSQQKKKDRERIKFAGSKRHLTDHGT